MTLVRFTLVIEKLPSVTWKDCSECDHELVVSLVIVVSVAADVSSHLRIRLKRQSKSVRFELHSICVSCCDLLQIDNSL